MMTTSQLSAAQVHRGLSFLRRTMLGLLACLATSASAQNTILWNSDPHQINLTSTGASMDSGFRFQLGVFAGSFVPNAGNIADWAANWVSAGHTAYLTSTARFASSLAVTSNTPPFTAGKEAYIWGFKGNSTSNEWILFRAPSWTWPQAIDTPGSAISWRAKDATVVIAGQIDGDGSPFLMKTMAVGNIMPPYITYDQWKSIELTGVPADSPGDNPDGDSLTNLFEFIYGTTPTAANGPVSTPVSIDSGHLVITIPRRKDRLANIIIEVSPDLEAWQSGSGFTEVLANGWETLVVRDLVTIDPAHPRRFLRLTVTLP